MREACALAFQHVTDSLSAATEDRQKEEDGADESEIFTTMRRNLNSPQKGS
jgi:hypothetical protein